MISRCKFLLQGKFGESAYLMVKAYHNFGVIKLKLVLKMV